MRKILNSNVFLAFVLVILLSIIGYILFDEYERNKNIKILNNIVKREKDLQNVKAAYEALLKDMEEEENIKAKNDNSNNDIKNSENDNKEDKVSENDNKKNKNPEDDNNDIINSKDDNKENKKPEDDNRENKNSKNDSINIVNSKDDNSDIKISEDDNKKNIILEKEEELAKESDKDIIRKSIDELNNIINENNVQIIDIFHKKTRISKEGMGKLEKINETFSEALDKYGDIYKQVSLRKKKSLEMEEGDTEKGK